MSTHTAIQSDSVAADDLGRGRSVDTSVSFARLAALGTLVGCAAIAVALWPVSSGALLTTWGLTALLIAAAIWRLGPVSRFRPRPALDLISERGLARGRTHDDRRTRRLLLTSLAAGTFWGATSVVLLPSASPTTVACLALVLAATAVLWLPVYALEQAALAALAAPALLPMALVLLTPPLTAPHAALGSLLLILLFALSFAAHIIKRMIETDCRAQRTLYERATLDPVVGIANHAEFHRRLADPRTAASQPYAVVFLDLDHFKAVNDTAGHAAGDRLLQQVGAILREEKRKADLAARLGGDEFALLMTHCSADEARRVADAVVRRVRGLTLHRGTVVLPVSASVGIACSSAGAPSPTSVLDAADQACYAAKKAGRNRVELAARCDASAHEDLEIVEASLVETSRTPPYPRVAQFVRLSSPR